MPQVANTVMIPVDEYEELQQNAARYLWLRDNKHLDIWWSVEGDKNRCKNIDNDIDAAMKGE